VHTPIVTALICHSASAESLLLRRAPSKKLRAHILSAREDVACAAFHGNKGGCIGKRFAAREGTLPSREELLASGYRIIKASPQ
jgi:hypothetical protein